MYNLSIKQIDAFTAKPFCGNPAGVINEADLLTPELMQQIAGEMNLSETGFISTNHTADSKYRINFFTPTHEVDMSGHVTIAACFSLIEDGYIELGPGVTSVSIQTKNGPVSLDVYFTPRDEYPLEESDQEDVITLTGKNQGKLKKIMLNQTIKELKTSSVPIHDIARILGVEKSEIVNTGLPLEIVSSGLDQLMIPINRKETILDLKPDLIKLGMMNRTYNIDTNHIFTTDTFHQDCISYARHFAPAVGMWEDPATGTAAAGLGTYLRRHGIISSGNMIMEQGKDIDALARIMVEVDSSTEDNNTVRIGGLAVTSITRSIKVDNQKILVV